MEKENLKKVGVMATAVAVSAFMASYLSGCATDIAAQNSTAATTQMQNSCKTAAYESVEPASPSHAHHRHHHHNNQQHHRHHHDHAAAPHHHGHAAAHKHTHKPAAGTYEAGQSSPAGAASSASAAAPVAAAPKKNRGNQCSGIAGQ